MTSDADFDAEIVSAIEESREEEKNRNLRVMTDLFPTLSYEVIHENLGLTVEKMVEKFSQLVEDQRLAEVNRPPTQNVVTVANANRPAANAKPIDQGLFIPMDDIDMDKFNREQVAEALWAELVRRQSFVDATTITRSASEQTKISMFLRDHFTTVKMPVITGMVCERDFYQCILILALCGYEGFEERLRKGNYLPKGAIIDKKAAEQREKEAKEMHRAELPDFANNMWKSYEDVIKLDYTESYLQMTRFDCPVCYDTFRETEAIFCTSLDPEFDEHMERHKFCKNCLHGHAIAASTQMLFGKGGAGVTCLEHGCKGVILEARVTPVLNVDEKKQFEERILNIAIQESGLKNLVKCQRCSYAIVNESSKEVDSIFECGNEICGFRYCRLCERPYDEKHQNKTCDQVMTVNDEARVKWEEKLTKICIRTCAKCGNEFTRDGGCSKMTCNRCGTTQCYLCRESGVDYNHFSDNGNGRCALWMNDQQVAARDEQERQNLIAAAKDEALLEADRQRLK